MASVFATSSDAGTGTDGDASLEDHTTDTREEEAPKTALEKQRRENIQRNNAKLLELGVLQLSGEVAPAPKKAASSGSGRKRARRTRSPTMYVTYAVPLSPTLRFMEVLLVCLCPCDLDTWLAAPHLI
jgi:hypothetical protein